MNTNTIPVSTHKKLHEVFLQFRVKIRGKSMTKKSTAIVDSAANAFGVKDKKKLSASTKLYQSDALKAVSNTAQAIRLFMKARTVRFGDYDVINSALYMESKMEVNDLVAKHEKAIVDFINQAEALKEKDRNDLGNLFSEGNYSSYHDLVNSYGVEVIVQPLPNFDQINVSGLDNETQQSLIERLNHTVGDDIKSMKGDLLRKLIYGKNEDSNEGQGNGLLYALGKIKQGENFKAATVTNVVEIAEIVENLNAIGDPSIDAFAKKITELFTVDVDDLKDSEKMRDKLVAEATDELDKIEQQMSGFA